MTQQNLIENDKEENTSVKKQQIVKSDNITSQITPMDMISTAIQSGIDIEKLDKLMDMQERWEKNEARKAYVEAMANFKTNLPEITKSKKVSFNETSYTYAPLDIITSVINPELSKNGLSYRWNTETKEGLITVTCVMTHILGHSESTSLSAGADGSGKKNSIQALGSSITYLQRYTLMAITGLAASEDNDGNIPDDELNEEQQEEIKMLLVESEVNPEIFLKYFKVEVIGELKMSNYGLAIDKLKKVINKNKEGKK